MATLLVLGLSLFATSAWSADKNFISVANSFGALSKVIDDQTQIPGLNEKPRKTTPDAEKVSQNLENDLETCETTQISKPDIVEINNNGSSMKFKTYHIKMDGPHCPVELETKMESQQVDNESAVIDFVTRIVLKHPDFIKKYNLKMAEINGHMEASIKQDPSGSIATHIKVNMNGSGDSTVIGPFSQSMGMVVQFDIDPMTFNLTSVLENTGSIAYNNVDHKIYGLTKLSGFAGMGNVEKKFTYDGAEISETDFQIYAQSFVLPGMVEEEDPSSPDSKVPTQCEFVVYEKSKVSGDQLRTLMSQGKSPLVQPVSSGKACNKNSKTNFSYQGQNYLNQISFDKDWINYSGSFLTGTEPTALFLIYQDEVPQTTESDEFTVGLQCKPVQYCY